MANTSPFNASFGINVANNLIVNTSTLTTNGLFVNSSGINVASTLTVSKNVASNGIVANTITHLNLIANLVQQNVISGNLATLKQLIANQAFVNSVSGNNATGFLNFTSNQVSVNTITANNATFLGNLALTELSSTSNLVFGNTTNFVKMTPSGFYYSDSGGLAKHMPAEVILQKGVEDNTASFTVNFSNEVNSGTFSSMRLVLHYYMATMGSNDPVLIARFCADGTTPTTSSYRWSNVFLDSDEGTVWSFGQNSDSGIFLSRSDRSSSINHCYHTEIFIPDVRNASGSKSIFSRSTTFWVEGFGAASPNIAGGWRSSMNLKGLNIFVNSGRMNVCHWVLTGIRA